MRKNAKKASTSKTETLANGVRQTTRADGYVTLDASQPRYDDEVDHAGTPLPDGDETSDSNRPVNIRYGYRRGKGKNREWLVFPQAWRNVFCRGHNPTKVAQMLRDKGLLRPSGVKGLMGAWTVNGQQVWGYVVTAGVLDLASEYEVDEV